jgi:LuxR family maltose regulon positive regulatory protein
VPRAALFARLDEGIERKLTLLSAPPGFGKTTLVSEWIAARRERVAWVSLDSGDNDPARFWHYVISACRSFDAELGRSALATLHTSQLPSFEVLLTTFINELAQLPYHCVLVLEDYHVVSSPEVHATVTFLLDHLPATLHLILMTRSEPPLPLARLRARHELNELTAADLRFSSAEIQAFLQQTLGVSISPEAIARIEERTEGWVAGLRLMTLASQGRPGSNDAERFLTTFTGGHRHVLEYLIDEVLAAQPVSLQTFLLQTSWLNRLTGSLCDAITGRDDSALLLEQLERANLFLISLGGDDSGSWYRYHTLFAEALRHTARQRWTEADLQTLQVKAAQWYEAHGLLAEAIETSLAAHTFDHAAALIERALDQRRATELHTLRRWFEQLPRTVMDEHPQLRFNEALAILFTSDRFALATGALVEASLRSAESIWRAVQHETGLGQVLALRSIMLLWQGDPVRASEAAREALDLLPDDETYWRGVSLLTAAVHDWNAGQLDVVQRTMMEARVLCELSHNIFGVSAAMLTLGHVYQAQIELDQAAEIYRQVLDIAGQSEAMQDDRGLAQLGLGMVAYERNDLTTAETCAAEALTNGQQRLDEDMQVHASVLLAQVQQARGAIAQAQATLNTLAAHIHRPLLLREVKMWKAQLALAAGDVDTAQRWSVEAQTTTDVPYIQQEQEALVIARLHLAEERPDVALELLDRWRVDAHANERVRSELAILCLTALAQAAQADRDHTRKTLMRALTIAQARGCQRIFLDEGEKLAELLQTLQPDLNKRPLARFATILLRAFATNRSTTAASTTSPASPLLEPLSAQEQRVLRLLAAGLSNPEIARELVVSTNTIKTQVQSIFRKLNVSNREEAAEIARELKLL